MPKAYQNWSNKKSSYKLELFYIKSKVIQLYRPDLHHIKFDPVLICILIFHFH